MLVDLTIPDVYHHFPSYTGVLSTDGIMRAEPPNAGAYDPYPNIPSFLHLYEGRPSEAPKPAAHAAAAAPEPVKVTVPAAGVKLAGFKPAGVTITDVATKAPVVSVKA